MPPTSTDWCRTISSCCFFILCSCRYIQQTQNTKWAAWPKKHRISECFLGETMVSCNTSRKNNPTIRPFWSILSFALRTSIWWYLHISLLHVFLHHMLNGVKTCFSCRMSGLVAFPPCCTISFPGLKGAETAKQCHKVLRGREMPLGIEDRDGKPPFLIGKYR